MAHPENDRGRLVAEAAFVAENGTAIEVEAKLFGRITTQRPAQWAAGGRAVTIGIRPERLRVLWDQETARHELSGTVIDRHYFGEITHLLIAIPGMDKPLSVTETNDFGADDIPVGAAIRIAYEPDALVAMAE